MKTRNRLPILLAGLFCSSSSSLWACTACYGQSDSPLAAGMNWGIFSLLAFIGLVLGGVAAFAIFLMRRAAAYAEQQVPMQQAEFEEMAPGRTAHNRTVGINTGFGNLRHRCDSSSTGRVSVAAKREA